MSCDTDPRGACHGKTGYASPQAARPTARRMRDARVYHCRFCGLWHVGHVGKKGKRRARND